MEQLQVSDVAPIYKKNYWNRVKGDQLPSGLDLCVFDFGVNAGTGSNRKVSTKDGRCNNSMVRLDNNFIRVLETYVKQEGLKGAIEKYQKIRLAYYKKLKHFKTFGKGWTRRNKETTAYDRFASKNNDIV